MSKTRSYYIRLHILQGCSIVGSMEETEVSVCETPPIPKKNKGGRPPKNPVPRIRAQRYPIQAIDANGRMCTISARGNTSLVVDQNQPWQDWPEFPMHPNSPGPCIYKPKQIHSIIVDYGSTPLSVAALCEKHGVLREEFYKLSTSYPQVMHDYEIAQQKRMEILAEVNTNIAEDISRDVIQLNGKESECLNPVAVRRAELRIKNNQWLMERLNPKYRQTTQINQQSININANLNVESPSTDPGDLISAIQGLSK